MCLIFVFEHCRCKHVTAIDIDPKKIDYAYHNAAIYEVGDHIDFIKGDFFVLAPKLKVLKRLHVNNLVYNFKTGNLKMLTCVVLFSFMFPTLKRNCDLGIFVILFVLVLKSATCSILFVFFNLF